MSNSKHEGKHVVACRSMPELRNWPGKEAGDEWSAAGSEVIRWLMGNDDIGGWVLRYFHSRGAVRYDREKGVWVGVVKSESVEDADFEVIPGIVKISERPTGRPSMISVLMGMDQGDLIDSIHEAAPGKRAAGRIVKQWSENHGIKISHETGMKAVVEMVRMGRLRMREEIRGGVMVHVMEKTSEPAEPADSVGQK